KGNGDTCKRRHSGGRAMAAATLTSGGKVHELGAETAATAKEILGRKRSGVFPADSEQATQLLSLLDVFTVGGAGDAFTLAFKGRVTVIEFRVEEDGLHFETVAAAPVPGKKPSGPTVKDLRVEVKALKAQGAVEGAYSKLRRAQLETVIAAAKAEG